MNKKWELSVVTPTLQYVVKNAVALYESQLSVVNLDLAEIVKFRAEINKILKNYDEKRIDLKNEHMVVYEEFKKEFDAELSPLVKLLASYDERIKKEEFERKNLIKEDCRDIYDEYLVDATGEVNVLPQFERILDGSLYLKANEGKHKSKFKGFMDKAVYDINFIRENYPRNIEYVHEYLNTLDVVVAVANVNKRMKDSRVQAIEIKPDYTLIQIPSKDLEDVIAFCDFNTIPCEIVHEKE